MAVTLRVDPTLSFRNFTSTAAAWSFSSWTVAASEKLVIALLMRAYSTGASGQRTLTVEWNGVNVPVKSTNTTVAPTQQEDIQYWVGSLDNPTVVNNDIDITASGNIRGMLAVGFFVDGADDTTPVALLDSIMRGASVGNSVTLTGAPSRTGSLLVTGMGLHGNTTVTSFTPTWTEAVTAAATSGGNMTATWRHTSAASTASVSPATQWAISDINRGGVLFEIVAAGAADAAGVVEAVSPSDAYSVTVAATASLTEAASPSDGTSALAPSNTSPENPSGVYTGAAAAWKLPGGADIKGTNDLTVSGVSASTLKGVAGTFLTTSHARRAAPAFTSLNPFSVEFWVKPTTLGPVFYIGPRSGGVGVQALQADLAADAFGVNTHFNYTGSTYDTNYTSVRDRLVELGVRYFRDNHTNNSTIIGRYEALGALGLKLQLVDIDGTLEVAWINSRISGGLAFAGVEGPNEWDNGHGDSTVWPPLVRDTVTAMFDAATADAGTNPIPFLGPSFANTRDSANLLFGVWPTATAQTKMDAGNLHDYQGAQAPEGSGGAGWGISLAAAIANYRKLCGPTAPIIATECGQRLSLGVSGQSAVTQRAAAKYVLRKALHHLINGVTRSYFYQLIENSGTENYGLLNPDRTPRAHFNAIKQFLALISDPGASFTPGRLNYTLTGTMTDVQQVLFQKRNGVFYLCVWLGVQSAVDAAANDSLIADIEPTRRSLTLNLPPGVTQIRVFEPSFSATAVSTATAPASVALSVPDHVQVVEITL